MKIDLSYIGFEETNHQGVLCYDPRRGVIELCQYYDYSDEQKQHLEQRFEAILSHELIHAILHREFGYGVSRRYDRLGETVYDTPYSYPQSL